MGSTQSKSEGQLQRLPTTEELIRIQQLERAWHLAEMRENWWWFSGGLVAINMYAVASGILLKNPYYFIPMAPSAILAGYYYDITVGEKHRRVTANAGIILANEAARFAPPTNNLVISQDDFEQFVVSRKK